MTDDSEVDDLRRQIAELDQIVGQMGSNVMQNSQLIVKTAASLRRCAQAMAVTAKHLAELRERDEEDRNGAAPQN